MMRIWGEDCSWLLNCLSFNAKTEAETLGLRRKQDVENDSTPRN